MSVEKNTTSFNAKANVNFCIQITRYAEVKKYNDAYLADLRKDEPDAKLPTWLSYRQISKDDVLTFGDKLLINEETGYIMQYPVEIFEQYNSRMCELPCKTKGHVEKVFEKTLVGLPLEEVESLMRKKADLTARFDVKPMLSKV